MSYEDDIGLDDSGIEVELSLSEIDSFLKSLNFKIPYFKDSKGEYLEYVAKSPHKNEKVYVRVYSINSRKQRINTYVKTKRSYLFLHDTSSSSSLEDKEEKEENGQKGIWEVLHDPKSHKRLINEGRPEFWNSVYTGVGVLGTIGLYSLYKRGVSYA